MPPRNPLGKSLSRNTCQVGNKKRNTINWLQIIRLPNEKLSWKVADPFFNPVILNNRGRKRLSNARHARAFRFSGARRTHRLIFLRCNSAPLDAPASAAGRGDELTTNVYETYYVCVGKLLHMCAKITTKAGQGQLRTPHNQSENSTFLTGKSAPPPSPADDAKRSPRSGPVNQKINTPHPPLL